MSGKAFQYYAFLMEFNEEINQAKMLLLPTKAKASRVKPIEKSKIQFILENGHLRPYSYLDLTTTASEFKKPEEITAVLRKAKGIIIPVDEKPSNFELYQEYFNTFNIKEPTFRRICRLCMIDHQKVTILPENYEYLVSGRKACQQCAQDELAKEFQSHEIHLSTHGMSHFYRVLNKIKDVDKILDVFSFDFKPTNNPEITIFDVIGDIDDLSQSKALNNVSLPDRIKLALEKIGIKKLLPIQIKALDAGLLKNKNLLIVAGTSSGKTLIGEIAGLSKVFLGQRMIYLSPLVALTNQKYEDFKYKYSREGLRVAIRVGMNKIDVGEEEQFIVDTDYNQADIITATFEAFDLLLRNGKASVLKNIGTIIIDEIQILNDKERGPELDGLIGRIKFLFPTAQIIGLSATIGNPEDLGKDLDLQVIIHHQRPIPLERHLILAKDQDEKEIYLKDLIRIEYNKKSTYGFFGQTIVFTNSRRQCFDLAMKLNKSGLKSIVYHSGLTYLERKKAEEGFAKGKYAAIVTTAALGAGVDFPASQVIFESLAMGIEWLTVAEFHQMIGRAGRLGYHDKGKVVLLVQPNKKYFSAMNSSEDNIAFELLTEPIEFVEPMMEGDNQLNQILAGIVALEKASLKEIIALYDILLGPTDTLKESLKALKNLDMINIYNEGPRATKLGRATSRTFLQPTESALIKQKFDSLSPLEIAIGLEPFTSIFLNAKIQSEIERVIKSGNIGSNLFSGSVLEFMQTALERKTALPKLIIDAFTIWNMEIFKCKCQDNPWCGCGEKAISRIVVEMRLENKNLRQISSELSSKYYLYAYPGDIYRWFDTLIHHLRAVAKLAIVYEDRKIIKLALNTIKLIEKPWIINKVKRG